VKRGCAVVSEDFILENMLKHKSALSKIPEANVHNLMEYSTYFYRFFKDFPPSNPRIIEASPAASW
jgi:hypothetical protein